MFEAVCLTILLSTVTCGASVVTDGQKENVTPQSGQLGDGKVQMNTTHETSDDHHENSLNSEVTPLAPFSNNENSEVYSLSSSVKGDVFRSHKNLRNGYEEEPFQEDISGVKPLLRLRSPRDAENISSSQLARLVVAMKTVDMENNELKATVKDLQETAEKLTKLQEVEAKSSITTAQQMMEATAAQQMTTGQMQLQISQLSTKMMKLQDDNEPLRAQLQNISEVTSAKSTKLQDENEALRAQLRNISEVTSIIAMKLQDENANLRVQLQNISEVTSAKTTKLQNDNEALRRLLQSLSEEANLTHSQIPHMFEKVGALQVQATLLDSKLRVHGDELTTINRSLRKQNTELEHRLNLQTSQLRKGDQDLLEKILNYTAAVAVGFHARLGPDTDTIFGGTLVVDRVVYNSGGGYNPITGVFTVPVTGLYLFLLNMASVRDVQLYIILDNIELCTTWSTWSKTLEMASCHAAAKAVKGQRVWVKTSDGQVFGDLWTTFTGVLIQREH